MPERFMPHEDERQFAVTIDSEESWNPESIRRCLDLYAKLGWEPGAQMPNQLIPAMKYAAVDYVPVKNPSEQNLNDFVWENSRYLSKAGLRMKQNDLTNDPVKDPDAGYVIDLLEKMVDYLSRTNK